MTSPPRAGGNRTSAGGPLETTERHRAAAPPLAGSLASPAAAVPCSPAARPPILRACAAHRHFARGVPPARMQEVCPAGPPPTFRLAARFRTAVLYGLLLPPCSSASWCSISSAMDVVLQRACPRARLLNSFCAVHLSAVLEGPLEALPNMWAPGTLTDARRCHWGMPDRGTLPPATLRLVPIPHLRHRHAHPTPDPAAPRLTDGASRARANSMVQGAGAWVGGDVGGGGRGLVRWRTAWCALPIFIPAAPTWRCPGRHSPRRRRRAPRLTRCVVQ